MHSVTIWRMANVQIRDVPPDVHQRLKEQAAGEGKSLNEYLLAQLAELAGRPTLRELFERIAQQEPYTGPSSAEIIREDRDRR